MKSRVTIWMCAALCITMLASCKKKETTSPVRKNIEEAVFASGYIRQENQSTTRLLFDRSSETALNVTIS